MRLYVDNALTQTFAQAPYEYSWDTTGVTNGAHTLRAEADDAAGNVGVSATVSVTCSSIRVPRPTLYWVAVTLGQRSSMS